MMNRVLELARLSVSDPQGGMGAVLDLPLGRDVLWPAFFAVVALSAVLYNVAMVVAPPPDDMVLIMPSAPFLMALLTGGVLVLTVFALHYIGRMFGGTGAFEGSLAAVIWLQILLLLAQVFQIGLLIISPVIGGLFGMGVGVFAIWLFVNFTTRVHGFTSLGLVFAGMVVSGFGVLFGLSILLAIVAAFTGLDVQNV